MKKIACMLVALILLIGSVPGCSESFTDTMKEVNDSTKEWYGMCIDKLLEEYDSGNGSNVIAICLHYYQMYIATEQLRLPLIELPFSKYGDSRTAIRVESVTLNVSEYNEGKYKEYINGEITVSEYIEYVRNMYNIGKNAREEAEKKIEDMKK